MNRQNVSSKIIQLFDVFQGKKMPFCAAKYARGTV